MNSRITAVETAIFSYPVTGQFKFFQTRTGRSLTRDTVLVKVTAENGVVGWGQSVPSHTWSYETIETVRSTIDQYLGPAFIGVDALDVDAVARVMQRTIAPSFSTGQPICKAGLDLAIFDLTGRLISQPAGARWQRSVKSQITLSWTVDVRQIDEIEMSLNAAQERGFRHFNVKVGRDAVLDVQVCRAIRQRAPSCFLWVDANGGYDLDTAIKVAPQFADHGVAALEQPFPANRLSWYGALREQRVLPILMDEGIVSLVELMEFHQLGLLDGVAMKVARCGGLTEARRIVEYVQQHDLLLFASGLTDPDLALAASLLLFGACGLTRPAALNAPQFLRDSILESPIVIDGDQAIVPTEVGLGVTVDENRLKGRWD